MGTVTLEHIKDEQRMREAESTLALRQNQRAGHLQRNNTSKEIKRQNE
jgi:hypothetical protein